MLSNTFIPFSILSLNNYLQKQFNININNIPIEHFKELVDYKYCKNIIDGKMCIRPCKKINTIKENEDFICSKCCKKNGIKRKRVYKLKKVKQKKSNMDENSDSGFYTEIDNNIKNTSKSSNNKKQKIEEPIFRPNYIINNKPKEFKLSIKNKNETDNCISFGELDFKLNEKYRNITNTIYKNHEKNNSKIINNKYNKQIIFGSLKFDIDKKDKIDIIEINKELKKNYKNNLKNNNNCIHNYLKGEDFNMNINSDLYYIFIYLVDLIFKISDINFIRNEIYSYLGDIGVEYYISQLNNGNL